MSLCERVCDDIFEVYFTRYRARRYQIYLANVDSALKANIAVIIQGRDAFASGNKHGPQPEERGEKLEIYKHCR